MIFNQKIKIITTLIDRLTGLTMTIKEIPANDVEALRAQLVLLALRLTKVLDFKIARLELEEQKIIEREKESR